MFDIAQLYFFIGAALALLLVPGPAVFYIVTRSVNQGRLAGLVSVLGIETANLVHVMAAALGLSAVFLSSALAYGTVKYLGAAYLIYLGIRKMIAREAEQEPNADERENLWRIYSQGFVVNLLNPKTALFFFAFLPQFVNLAKGNVTSQIFSLGVLFVSMATITDGIYALLASSVARRLQGNRAFLSRQRIFAGLVYVGLGVTTALSGSKSK